MSAARAAIIALALIVSGCATKASGPPDIAVDRTVCSHCGMLVSEPAYAAAFQPHDSEPRVFDDIGCLLDAMRREPVAPVHVWFQDADGGGWLTAGNAVFVASSRIRTPMSGGLLAYSSVAAAEKAAALHEGTVVLSFEALMKRKGVAR